MPHYFLYSSKCTATSKRLKKIALNIIEILMNFCYYFRYNTTAAEKLRETLSKLEKKFQEEIRPVWKKSFISLYCFLPW